MPSRPSRKAAAKPARKRARRDSGDAGQQADEHDEDIDGLAVRMFAALNYDALSLELSDDEGKLDPEGVAGRDQLTRAEWLAMRRLVHQDRAGFDQQVRQRLDNGDPDDLESAALDALHGPEVQVAPPSEAPTISHGLQEWVDEIEHIRDVVQMLREGRGDAPGCRFAYNMSLVQHKVGDNTEIDFIHWTRWESRYGQIIRLDKNNAMIVWWFSKTHANGWKR